MLIHMCVLINQPMTFPKSVGPAIKAGISGRLPPLSHLGRVTWLLRDLRWQGLLQAGQWSLLTLIRKIQYPSTQASGDMSPQKAVALGKLKVRGNFLLLQKLQGIFWTFSILRINVRLAFSQPCMFPLKYSKVPYQICFIYFGLSLSKT